MKTQEYVAKVGALKGKEKENHKRALVHLIALHTDNKPDAIEASLKAKDGFAQKKINAIDPTVMGEIYKSALHHGNLKGKK